MSKFTNLTAINASIESLGSGTNNPISVISNVNLNSKNITNVRSVNLQGALDILYDANYNSLAIKATNSQYRGIVYDNIYNRPFEQILPATTVYNLPTDMNLLLSNIIKNPSLVYVINSTQNVTINLPRLPSINQFQNIHLRLSNISTYLINIIYNEEPIIQIGYERASLIWRSVDGVSFTWVYVP
jgi:hypothetical protein